MIIERSRSNETAAILLPSELIATQLMPPFKTPLKTILVSRVRESQTQMRGFAPNCPETTVFPATSILVMSSVCSKKKD